MKRIIYVIILIFISLKAKSQDINFNYVISEELEVCQSSVPFELSIINNTGSVLSNPTYEIQLPTGIIYEDGSLIEVTDHGLVAYDVDLSSELQFISSDIPIGDSVRFQIRFFAKMDAVAFQESGGIFRNNIVVVHDDGMESDLSSSYNILYPSLNVLDLSPTSQTVLSGDTTTRSFKIVNAGFGKTDLVYITDVFSMGASLVSVDIGTVVGDTIILSGSDFNSIGNGDNYLDNNESIIIEETIAVYSCSDITSSSTIRAFWGCEETYNYSANNYAHVSVDFQSPNLKLIAVEDLNSCFGSGAASVQELQIVNTGSGNASDVVLDLFKSLGSDYDVSIFSRFDEESIRVKVGAGAAWEILTPFEAYTTLGDGAYECLGGAPIGRVLLNLPDISPADTVFVKWDMYSCCIQVCEDQKVKGWKAEIEYADVCALTTYNKSLLGQGVNSQLMSFFTETPTDIYDGEQEDYTFIVSSFSNSLPENENSEYVVEFTLDENLTFQSLVFQSNGVEWVPTSVVYDAPTNLVSAKFPVPIPFTVPKSEIILTLSGSCGSPGWKTIKMDVFYNPDNTCEGSCLVPLVCDEEVTTYLHCPILSCEGLHFLSYDAARINFGLPDADLDGLPDDIGELNMALVKSNRAMVGDTVQTRAVGEISSDGDSWSYGKLITTNNYGANLSLISVRVEVYDASTELSYVVDGLPAISTISGSEQEFEVNLSILSLSDLNPDLVGYSYSNGDSLKVISNYEVVSSIAGLIKETLWENDFYISGVADPGGDEKLQCDQHFARTTLIGYSWRNDNGTNNTIRSCSKNITQSIGLSIGDCCSNYAGGNLFPNEYRHWGYIKEAKVVIPDNYALVNTFFRQVRTRKTNSTSTQTLTSIVPDLVIGDTLYYNLEQYYSDGGFAFGDDGFNGLLRIELAPNCDVPQGVYEPVEWFFNYQKSANLGSGETGYIGGGNDQVRYIPSNLELTSSNPWVDANTREVEWDLKVQNTSSSDAAYTWVHIDAPENLTINSVTNDATGETLPMTSDLFLVGTINDGSTKNLSVQGTITNCDTLLFDVYAGYECVGYPDDFASFECNISDMVLYVEPKPSAFQVRLYSEPLMDDPCSPLVEVALEISSVKIANMYDMSITAVVPSVDKIAVEADSSYFKYNMDNSYTSIPDPSLTDSIYFYDINIYDPSFSADGIPGVLDLSNNRYALKTTTLLGAEFLQGDYIQFQINGKNACATDLPTIFLDYDPNSLFIKDNTAGLHVYSGDNWSASWGDYDNDGFEDIFVPNKNAAEPSALYHNNGDGTLSRIYSGDIANDLGESVSSTWGDYDNDGDLDLFVANNTYSKNKLYQNQGDGTFISLTEDPVVDLGVYSHSSSWADYDNDGHLDLVVSDIHPTNFNFLFHNNGDGSFEEVASSVICQTASSAVGASWADYDNDGDQDLFIANTNGENNNLYRNDGGVFVAVETGDIVNDGGHSIGGTWGDYDNDLDLDLLVTNSRMVEPNFFYENNGDGTFTKITTGVIISNFGNSHGASWMDYDNDGDVDLLVANDQANKNFLFTNNGDGSFTKVTNAITEEESNSYGTAWADYDNDGDYDLHISNHSGTTNDFFINEKGACNNYIGILLEGCNSNRSGIGAKIKVKASILGVDTWQIREISAQNSALGGQNSLKAIFGLADAAIIDSLVVKWPSGLTQVLTDQLVNQSITINEDCGAKICGFIFYDENGNDVQDEGELGIPNKKLIITPGDIEVSTNHDGYYQLYVTDDIYNIQLAEDADWTQTYPMVESFYEVDVNSEITTEYCGNDFATIPTCMDPDLTLDVGATAFRRGLTNDLLVKIENEGAFSAESTIELELKFSDNTYLQGEDWYSVTELEGYRTYTYIIDSLDRLSDTLLRLVDSVDALAALDEAVTLNASINYLGTECSVENNEVNIYDVVVGSIDPNDKQVLVKNHLGSSHVQRGDTILYKIRFQNVGNYAARRVLITDTLSPYLDWSTIEILESGHSFSTSIVDGIITWVNNNIELPDSTSDPEGSCGSVSFSVRLREDCPSFSIVENKASIQFDYNEFIITNNTELLIVPIANFDNNLFIYPNPTNVEAEIRVLGELEYPLEIETIQVSDVNGRNILFEQVNEDHYQLRVNDFKSGIYTVSANTVDGERYHGRLIVP